MSAVLKVLIVDDSATTSRMLTDSINATADMRVVGEARNGRQAIQMTHDLRPDVILMDLVMPEMDGLEATREIMHATPTPIVVVSASLKSQETEIAFRAISAGALTVQRKPAGPGNPAHPAEIGQLLNTLRAMAGVRVIHHWKRTEQRALATPTPALPAAPAVAPPEIVAIVASTGGPAALSTIAQALPPDFPLPIVVVQHIAPDFVPSLAGWLATVSPLRVELARASEAPRPGCIYLATGGEHLTLTQGHRFAVNGAANGSSPHVPSGDVLLESVARSYGARAIGVVLTGMGNDGARGLRAMYDAGAYTIAQDEATSVVFGMPNQARLMGGVRRVLPLPEIPQALIRLSGLV